MGFAISVEAYMHYPTHTSPDNIIVMNKVFLTLFVTVVLTVIFRSNAVLTVD